MDNDDDDSEDEARKFLTRLKIPGQQDLVQSTNNDSENPYDRPYSPTNPSIDHHGIDESKSSPNVCYSPTSPAYDPSAPLYGVDSSNHQTSDTMETQDILGNLTTLLAPTISGIGGDVSYDSTKRSRRKISYYSKKYLKQKRHHAKTFEIFVCNIAYTISEDEIRSLFEDVVRVTRFKLVNSRNRHGKVVKRFAFVSVESLEELERALELDGFCVDDRPLIVRRSQRRPRRT